jgi:hypothetical protein
LWSSFFAIGVALGGALTSLAVDHIGTGGVMGGWAALLALAGLVAGVCRSAMSPPTRRRRGSMPRPAAWFATLAFGIYTFLAAR